MASYQEKIGWKRIGNIENKNYTFVSFLPGAQKKIPKKFIRMRRMRKIENKNYPSIPF